MVSVIIYKYNLEEFSEKMSSYPEKNSQQIFKMEIDVCVTDGGICFCLFAENYWRHLDHPD